MEDDKNISGPEQEGASTEDPSQSEVARIEERRQISVWRSLAADMKARGEHRGDLGRQVLELHKIRPVVTAQGPEKVIAKATIDNHVCQWTLMQELLGPQAPKWLIDVGQTDWLRVLHKTREKTRSQMNAIRTSFRRVMDYVGKPNLVTDANDPGDQRGRHNSALFSHIQSIPSGLGSDAHRLPALRRAFGNERWSLLCVDIPLRFGLAPAQIERLRPMSCLLATHVVVPAYYGVGKKDKTSKVVFAASQIEYSSDPEWREQQIAVAARLTDLFGNEPIGLCMGTKRFQTTLGERLTAADRLAREREGDCQPITITRLQAEFFRDVFLGSFPVDIENSLKLMDADAVRKREIPLREAFLDAYQQCGRVHPHLRDVATGMSEQESSARWWARRLRGLFPAVGELGIQDCWLTWCPADRDPYVGTAFTILAQTERRLKESELEQIARLAQQLSGAQGAVLPWYEEQVPQHAVRIFKRRAWF